MEIIVKQDRVLVFKDVLVRAEAESVAWRNKSGAFGTLNQVTSFLTKPKDDDFRLINQEYLHLPFWHVVGTATYTYDRTATHQWPATGEEVTSITIEGKEYPVKSGQVSMQVLEKCHQQHDKEVYIDGLTNQLHPTSKNYLTFAANEVDKHALQILTEKSNVATPKSRASALVRDVASQMIHKIEADHIYEEKVTIEHIDLYYRPVFNFTYEWLSKRKQATVTVDGLTGAFVLNQPTFPELLGKVVDYDFLFDVGSDAAGTLIPGGGIAVKIAKKYIDSKRAT
jgi:hypothetical protein